MSLTDIGPAYYAALAAWLVLPLALFWRFGRDGRMPGVLVFAYVFQLFVIHWLGALAHASPWASFADTAATAEGFGLSTLALAALLAGAFAAFGWKHTRRHVPALPPAGRGVRQAAGWLLALGGLTMGLGFTPLANAPSVSSIVSMGQQCTVLAIGLTCLAACREKNRVRFRLWIALAFLLPVVTVLTRGFVGYGINMLGTALVFVAMVYRPRWLLMAGLAGGVYAGLSLWVAYAAHRDEVRASVWGGESAGARLEALGKVFEALRPFDISNDDDLVLVDVRLNQNALVGRAMQTTPELVPFENGKTIYDAMMAIVPRAIWPEKPVVGGSGDYVSAHTLQEFAAGTSIGMGQVLELYINFGMWCVVVGFFLLGWLLRHLDQLLIDGLERGDLGRVSTVFLIGAGALQPGGALAEIVSSMAAGGALGLGLTWSLGLTPRAGPARARGLAS